MVNFNLSELRGPHGRWILGGERHAHLRRHKGGVISYGALGNRGLGGSARQSAARAVSSGLERQGRVAERAAAQTHFTNADVRAAAHRYAAASGVSKQEIDAALRAAKAAGVEKTRSSAEREVRSAKQKGAREVNIRERQAVGHVRRMEQISARAGASQALQSARQQAIDRRSEASRAERQARDAQRATLQHERNLTQHHKAETAATKEANRHGEAQIRLGQAQQRADTASERLALAQQKESHRREEAAARQQAQAARERARGEAAQQREAARTQKEAERKAAVAQRAHELARKEAARKQETADRQYARKEEAAHRQGLREAQGGGKGGKTQQRRQRRYHPFLRNLAYGGRGGGITRMAELARLAAYMHKKKAAPPKQPKPAADRQGTIPKAKKPKKPRVVRPVKVAAATAPKTRPGTKVARAKAQTVKPSAEVMARLRQYETARGGSRLGMTRANTTRGRTSIRSGATSSSGRVMRAKA